jgi:hypothetical protein
VFASLNRHIADNAIIAVDVGNNTYSFGAALCALIFLQEKFMLRTSQ